MTRQPSKWKIAVLVWFAIYPIITILSGLWGDALARITPLPLQTLVSTLVVVPLTVFLMMPFLERLLKDWLHK